MAEKRKMLSIRETVAFQARVMAGLDREIVKLVAKLRESESKLNQALFDLHRLKSKRAVPTRRLRKELAIRTGQLMKAEKKITDLEFFLRVLSKKERKQGRSA